ncbi:MAG TPA: flavodoxin family protein [Clostridiales bacterium]|jgi:multimeric flavodoxin WrbA|nr:flavodoxin family protein [Clostridiales bacterium]
MSDILVLTGSPRPDGNSRMLADSFVDGAVNAGLDVKVFHTAGMDIAPCLGCEYCRSHEGQCIQIDDMQLIMPHLHEAKVVVFATPLYFYGMSAQLKLAVDRMYALLGRKPAVDSCVLLASYADEDGKAPEALIAHYKAFTGYSRWKNLGIVTAGCVHAEREIAGHPALDEARRLGESMRSVFGQPGI